VSGSLTVPNGALLVSLIILSGGASFAMPASALSGPPSLAKALGSPAANPPLSRKPARRVAVTIGRAGFMVSHRESAVSLARDHLGVARWKRFDHGVSRRM
jgi:hypothetical protein